MAKTYKVSTVEVSAQSRKEWLARKRGKGEVAASAAAVVVQSEASSAPSALDALFRQVNIGTDDAPKYVAEALFPLRIGDALLDWHADQKYLGVEHATESEKANFFATGGVSCGGIGSSSGGGTGGGGSTTLAGLNDVSLKSAIANDMLVYNGTHWVNTPMSAIKPDLTAYATKTWVEGKGYITDDALAPYALKTELPSLAGYATEEFVTTRGYITASALDPYAKSADVAETYATQTALQGVDIRVQAIEYIFEKDQDGVINKWQEIVDFLAGVEGTTLDSILEQFATKDSVYTKTQVDNTLSNYLLKSGGYMTGTLTMFRGSQDGHKTNAICFDDQHWRSYLYQDTDVLYWGHHHDPSKDYILLNSGNYTNYTVPKTGGEFIGAITLPVGGLTIKGKESSDINARTFPNSLWGDGATVEAGGMASIRNGLVFNWHASKFVIGEVRNFNTTSIGFGVGMVATKEDGTEYQKNLFRVGTDGEIYQNGVALSDKYIAKTGGTFTGSVTAPTFIGNLNGTAASANTLNPISIIDANAAGNGYGWINPWATGVNAPQAGNLISLENGENSATQFLSAYHNDDLFYRAKIGEDTWTDWEKIIHTGNLNALSLARGAHLVSNVDFNDLKSGIYDNEIGNGSGNLNAPSGNEGYYGVLVALSAASPYNFAAQFHVHNSGNIKTRGCYANTWSPWKTIAFTDSNVASATKLQTARTIWGRSFDGTGNVDGDFATNGSVRIGDAILSWDATNKCLTIKNATTGEKASLFVDGGVTATAIN